MKPYKLDLGYQLKLEHEAPAIYKLENRFKHFYIVGASGKGKSVFMERMAQYDLSKDISIIYIDPKGESVKKLYHLSDRPIKYISKDRPIVINPLQKNGYPLDTIIDEFVRVLDVLITLTSINPESSVRMKELLNMAIKCFTPEQINFKYLADFLHYEEVRKRHRFGDTEYEKYWKEFDVKQGKYYVNRDHHTTAKSVSSRLLQFIENDEISPFIIGENELNISELLKNGESLLVDTSGFTKTNKIFLSNLIFHAVATYLFYDRLKIPLLVYIDEFQTVASDLIRDILEYGRSEKVGFTLAHHDFSEIKNKDIIKSVISGAQSVAAFRCGPEEDKTLAPIFNLKEHSLLHLEDFNAWLKLNTDYILIETYPPVMKDPPEMDLPKKQTPQSFYCLRDAWIPITA